MFMAVAANNQCCSTEECAGPNPVSLSINSDKREGNKWTKAEEAYLALGESLL